ncbi:MAG: DUF2200 domain-containing protein [Spirochaetia bacterium]|nr:DUF2200 domain-containing protein [Spirochaetia bacterium]
MTDPDKAAKDAARVRRMAFGGVYPLYVAKAERKGRTKDEVDAILRWLTGYDQVGLERRVADGTDFEAFFGEAPRPNPNADRITGVVCGVRVEEVADPVLREVRRLDKLVDELAKGRPMEKILRS